jgi:hypothetical protein
VRLGRKTMDLLKEDCQAAKFNKKLLKSQVHIYNLPWDFFYCINLSKLIFVGGKESLGICLKYTKIHFNFITC